MTSRQEGTSLTQLVRELLDQAMHARQETQRKRIYQALRRLRGFVKDPVTDASTTIDEVLYGENGAWHGSYAEDER